MLFWRLLLTGLFSFCLWTLEATSRPTLDGAIETRRVSEARILASQTRFEVVV
jgi:hypothetical protein